MIAKPTLAPPSPAEMADLLGSDTRSDQQHWADAAAVTTALFGDAVMANMFVVGMAVQSGTLPISVSAIEEAITLNGVAIDRNLDAFRWGRVQVADPDAVVSLLATTTAAGGAADAAHSLSDDLRSDIRRIATDDEELHRTLVRLTADLVGFQDAALARHFLDKVGTVADAERRIGARAELTLTRAAATNLHRLTAYKDEYEVARLMTSTDGLADAHALAGPDGAIAYKLHPPMLRALGMDRKITLGSWVAPGVKALAKAKRLRGTALDPFGRAEVRKVERELIPEYEQALSTIVDGLTADNLENAVAIASLPDQVRGYEDLKLRRAKAYRHQLSESLAAFASA